MLGRSELLERLEILVSLLILFLSEVSITAYGASRSSSLAHAMLILKRFSRVTGVTRLDVFLEEEDDDDDDVEEDLLLRRTTGLTGTSSSTVRGLKAAPIML